MANVNIVGRREEGKTTLALYLSRRYAGRVIWDPRGMIGDRSTAVIVCTPEDLETAIREGDWRRGPIVYRQESDDVPGEFTAVCQVLFPRKFTKGGFAFIIDEAGELQNPHSIHPELLRIVKQHPTFPPEESVLIIQTNHRLSEFNNSCKALMNELYIFQTTLPRDLDVIDQHTGIPEIREIVKTLPRHHCVRYIYGRQEDGVPQYEVWDNPKMWYTPLKGGSVSKEDNSEQDEREESTVDRNYPRSEMSSDKSHLFEEDEYYA